MNVAQLFSAPKSMVPQEGAVGKMGDMGSSSAVAFHQLLGNFLVNSSDSLPAAQEGQQLDASNTLSGFLSFMLSDAELESVTLEESSVQDTELLSYLEKLVLEFEEMNEAEVEKLDLISYYALLQEIPVTLNVNQSITAEQQTDSSVGRLKEELASLVKWALLLEQSRKHADHGATHIFQQTKESGQLQELLVNLKDNWNQNQDWLRFLEKKLQSELSRLMVVATEEHTNREEGQAFKSFIPSGLLGQVQQNQALRQENQALAETDLSTQLPKSSAQVLQVEPQQVMLEAKGKEGQVDQKLTEQSIPTARFHHLLQDVKEIMRSHFQLLKQEEASQIRIKLFPEHLGHLDIRVVATDGKISAFVVTSSALAKEALEQQVNQLRFALVQQGVQVDKIEVTQQSSTNHSLFNQDPRQGQQFTGQRGHSQSSKGQLPDDEQEQDTWQEIVNETTDITNINYVV